MQIYITRDGQQLGPYTLEQINSGASLGSFTSADLAWIEGWVDWQPLSKVPGFVSSMPPMPSESSSGGRPSLGEYSDAEIRVIASNQKAIMWLILGSFVAFFIPYAPIITGILSLIFVYQLARAVRSSFAWVYAVLALIPFVGLIALLIINSQATQTLKRRGIRVGLMGADQSDLANLNSREPLIKALFSKSG